MQFLQLYISLDGLFDIRNITLEKKLENITIVINNLLTELNITVDVLTSRTDPG